MSQCVVTHHLSYNLCQQFSHAHLCHTPTSCLRLHTHQPLSHTLRHIPSFTHNFVAHRLSHTIFHKSLWLKQKRLEQKTFWTSNSCFVCRHVYLAASPACFGMFAFLACLVQAKVTGAENFLDIKFMFRLPACLRSYVSGMFYVPGRFFHRLVLACLLFWHV